MALEKQVAIITGAGMGIGRATAILMAAEGIDVVICDINSEKMQYTAGMITASGGKVQSHNIDVRDSEAVHEMINATLTQYGHIDILVNNAGGAARKDAVPFHQSDEKLWNRIISINLMGTLICTRAVINQMMKQNYGRIINMASIAGVIGADAEYAAAKGGIIAFTKSLARQYGSFNITVNCLSPGAIATEGVMTGRPGIIEKLVEPTVLRRAGSPEEVASLVAYLASEAGSFITGQNIIIDGGKTIGKA